MSGDRISELEARLTAAEARIAELAERLDEVCAAEAIIRRAGFPALPPPRRLRAVPGDTQ